MGIILTEDVTINNDQWQDLMNILKDVVQALKDLDLVEDNNEAEYSNQSNNEAI